MAEKKWTAVIKAKDNPFKLNIKEHWKYRDLIWLFVQRDFKTRYKQTVLGPLWFVIAPLFNTVIYTVIFGNIAGLAEAGVPTLLFYMIGNLTWTFFTGSFNAGQTSLAGNAALFSKVYFPRLVPTISSIISNGINFAIQFIMFLGFFAYFAIFEGFIGINWIAALTPLFLIQLSLLGMGVGLIVSSFTVKYRDLLVLVSFALSAWMYITPVIYASSTLGPTAYKVFMCNPVSPVVELMRYGWLGCGTTPWLFFGISWAVTLIICFFGIVAFNKTQKNFLDTV
ncbi:MAG: ABC transporter permease [Clostridia bacterium]|nr:ABC transporter permease [Clostridia bacterium]